MTTLEGLLQRYGNPSAQLCRELRAVLERAGSPEPVRCTKRLYNALLKLFDKELASKHYDGTCTLLQVIRYIAKGSHAPASGFGKLLVFGLPQKHMVQWCTMLCSEPGGAGGWTVAMDELLFTASVVLDYSNEAKLGLVPLIPSLLRCITTTCLPCSARIEAARGANSLLEVCGVEHKQLLYAKPEIQAVIGKIGHSILSSGDFELQVAIVECVFRITTVQDRTQLSQQWFPAPAVHQAFGRIRESEFETDCRDFLNLLNSGAGENRSVHSLPCKEARLGTFQLLHPRDPGLKAFWVDFNSGSASISLFVEEPSSSGHTPSEGLWETVVIKETCVKEWELKVQGGDFVLRIALTEPAHTLLPSLPPSPSHQATIVFSPHHDPSLPLWQVFPGKAQLAATVRAQASTALGSPATSVKSSIAITPLHILPKTSSRTTPLHKTKPLRNPQRDSVTPTVPPLATSRSALNKQPLRVQTSKSHALDRGSHDPLLQEISPIEPPPNTPCVGGHLSSQGSATPPNQTIPVATPSTSTPKHRPQLEIVGGRAVKGRHVYSQPASRLAAKSQPQAQGSSRRTTSVKPVGKKARQGRSGQEQRLKAGSFVDEGKTQLEKPCNSWKATSQSAGKKSAVAGRGRGTGRMQGVTAWSQQGGGSVTAGTSDGGRSSSVAVEVESLQKFQQEPRRKKGQKTQPEPPRGKSCNPQPEPPRGKSCNPQPKPPRGKNCNPQPEPPRGRSCNPQPEPPGEDEQKTQRRHPGKRLNTSQAFRDLTNHCSSQGTGQRRLFNLSAAPACGRGKKSPASTKPKPRSTHLFDFTDSPRPEIRTQSHNCVSLNSTASSGPDVIPDSMPLQQSQRRRSRHRLTIPPDGSFSFDSDLESVHSWDGSEAWKGKKATTSTAAKKTSASTAAKKTSASTAAKKTTASTAAKKTSASTAAKKTTASTAAKKTTSSTAAKKTTASTAAKKTTASTAARKTTSSTAARKTSDSSRARNAVPLLSSSRTQKAGGREGKGAQLDTAGKRKEAPPTDSAPSSKRRKLARLSSGYISLESSPASSSDTGTPAHHPTAPSPSSTLHSSQVLADANLTAEFQHICQTLVAGAGGKPQPHPLSEDEGDPLSQNPQDMSQLQFHTSFSSDAGPSPEQASLITLTQLSRDIISRSCQAQASQAQAQASQAQAGQARRSKAAKATKPAKTKTAKTTMEKAKAEKARLARPSYKASEADSEEKLHRSERGHMTPLASRRKPPVINTTPTPLLRTRECSLYGEMPLDDQNSSMDSASQEVPHPPIRLAGIRKRKAHFVNEEDTDSRGSSPSLQHEEPARPDHLSPELKALISTFTSKLNTAVKSKRSKLGQFASSASKTTSGQLQQLWEGQQRERVGVLGAFRQQLARELGVLEGKVQQAQETEEQATSQLRLQLKSLAASLQAQQTQVERLRALQLSLHEQLGGMEDRQGQQQLAVQRSLKRNMHQLQKKLLGDSQRQEVARIRQTLQTMLLQV